MDLINGNIDNCMMYSASFEYANIGICYLALDGKILGANMKFCSLVDYSRQELLNMNYKEITYAEDLENSQSNYKKLADGEINSIAFEQRYIKKDKSVFWAKKMAIFIKNAKDSADYILTYVEDITDQKNKDDMMRVSKERFKLAFDLSPDSVNINRLSDGLYIDINKGFTRLMGYTFDEVIGKTSLELDIWNNQSDRQKLVHQLTRNGFVENFEAEFKAKNGDIHVALMSASIIKVNGDDCIVSITRDISERKQLEQKIIEEKELLDITLSSVGDGVISTDTKGKVVLLNEVAQRLTGFSQDDAVGLHFDTVFPIINEITQMKSENPIAKVLETGMIQAISNHTVLLSRNGIEIPIENSASPIKDKEGKIHGVVSVFRDVTTKRIKQKENEYIMVRDQLTGLYNRKYFTSSLEELNKNKNIPVSVIMADVNGLKITNDAFGHAVGDELLIKTANILNFVCRKEDIIARLGGDEFVIILPNTEKVSAEGIIKEIKRLTENEMIGFVQISIAFGCETKTSDNEDLKTVYKKAEDNMYVDKLFEHSSRKSNALSTIINTLYEKNSREKQHSERVSQLCEAMGRSLEMSNSKIKQLRTIGLLHDIGKIAISDNIINKEGPLNNEEYNEIKRHPEIGYRILNTVSEFTDLYQLILFHHERWDGKGYPKGLTEESIPLESRIIAIADSYDAMTNDRPYRKALTKEEAIDELRKNKNKQFDAKLVDIFIDEVLNQL